MEAGELTQVVCEAITIALRRHKDRNAALTDQDRGDVRTHIESVYTLRGQAADQNLALLEIGCDAAAQFARDFNYQNPTGLPMEPKWTYILIQALLAPQLKPELVAGDVPSLIGPLDTDAEAQMTDEGSAVDEPSVAAMSNNAAHKDTASQWGPEKPLQSNRSFWLGHEIKQLIWLDKYKGYHQAEVARKLGRTLHSVTNKWGKVTKDESWKEYMTECESSRILGEDSSRPSTPEMGEALTRPITTI